METPIPIPPPNQPPTGWTPTAATVSGGVAGAAVAQVAVWVLGLFHIPVDAATAAALASLLGVIATYLHPAPGGRK